MVGLRLGNAGGIVVGYGDGGNLIASDLLALLPYTSRVVYVDSGEIAVVTSGAASYRDLEGRIVEKEPIETERTHGAAARGSYAHFMLKEIYEQPESATSGTNNTRCG